MKSILSSILLVLIFTKATAQKDSFDIITYTPLEGWDVKDQNSFRAYSYINKNDKSWCQVAVYKSTASKGSIEADFESEWNELAATPYKITDAPEKSPVEEADGWKIISGSGKFSFNDANAAVILTTFSGYGRCVSIVATTANQRYLQNIIDFIGTVALKKPGTNDNDVNTIAANDLGPDNTQRNDGFAFSSTNFDDGWTSVIKENWVEVTKGTVKVLLHFPKDGTIFPADAEPLVNAAWNLLVAPRYSNLQNFKVASTNNDYRRPYIGMASVTENATGKKMFVVLFKRSAGWIEVVSPDVKTFINEFGFDPTSIRWGKLSEWLGGYIMEINTGATVEAKGEYFNKIDDMLGRNKFAVSEKDLAGTGRWDQHFSSNTYWTNVYTGNSAGISTYSSSQWFIFSSGQSYKWHIVAVNSYGGVSNAAQADGAGSFKSLNNWQLFFSNIEGKAKTYDAYFTAIKGGRVLWLNDAKYPGSGIFQGFSKKQN